MECMAEKWKKICRDPFLKNLPCKVQTDKWGNIMMSPAGNEHGIFQAKIVTLISRLTDSGVIISECSILPPKTVQIT